METLVAEAGVICTNGDATSCKRSAVELGYWKDRYLKPFCQGMPVSATPLISTVCFISRHAVHYENATTFPAP